MSNILVMYARWCNAPFLGGKFGKDYKNAHVFPSLIMAIPIVLFALVAYDKKTFVASMREAIGGNSPPKKVR